MKIRTLLMGSAAAALIAVGVNTTTSVTTTEAADVRACDRYGDGFYYIPGSDTCVGLSGRVRSHYETTSFERTNTTRASNADVTPATVTDNNGLTGDDLRTDGDTELVTNGRVQFDIRSPSDIGTVRSVARFSGDTSGTSFDALRIHVGSHITFGTHDSFFTRHNNYGHPVANFDGPYGYYDNTYIEFTGAAGPVDFTVGVENGIAGASVPTSFVTGTEASSDGVGGGAEDLAFYAGAKYAYDGIGSVAVHYLAEANNAASDLQLVTTPPTDPAMLAAANTAVSSSTDGEATLGVAFSVNAVDNLSLVAWYFTDDDGQGRVITGAHTEVLAFGGSYTFGDWSIGAGYGITSGAPSVTAETAIAGVEPEITAVTVELGWNIADNLKAELAWQASSEMAVGADATTNSRDETDTSEVRLRIVRNW